VNQLRREPYIPIEVSLCKRPRYHTRSNALDISQNTAQSLANIVVYICNLINGGVTFDETGLIRREEVII
jgi:hypothetical protein